MCPIYFHYIIVFSYIFLLFSNIFSVLCFRLPCSYFGGGLYYISLLWGALHGHDSGALQALRGRLACAVLMRFVVVYPELISNSSPKREIRKFPV